MHNIASAACMLYVYRYINMIVVCPSVRLFVMEGQQKRFDLETQGTVSLALD